MSRVSDAFDALLLRIQAQCPSASGWMQIPNPMDVPSNPSLILKQGYGLHIGPATNRDGQVSCHMWVDRRFTITLSTEMFKTDSDADGYIAKQKSLMESLFLILKDLELNNSLNSGLNFQHYISDTGPQPIEGQDFSVIFVQCEVVVSLLDNLLSS